MTCYVYNIYKMLIAAKRQEAMRLIHTDRRTEMMVHTQEQELYQYVFINQNPSHQRIEQTIRAAVLCVSNLIVLCIIL